MIQKTIDLQHAFGLHHAIALNTLFKKPHGTYLSPAFTNRDQCSRAGCEVIGSKNGQTKKISA